MCLMPPRTRPRLTRPHFGPGGQAQNGGTWAVRAVRGKFEGGKVISASRSRSCTTPPLGLGLFWVGIAAARAGQYGPRRIYFAEFCQMCSRRHHGGDQELLPQPSRVSKDMLMARPSFDNQPPQAKKGVWRELASGVKETQRPTAGDCAQGQAREGEEASEQGGQADSKTGRQEDRVIRQCNTTRLGRSPPLTAPTADGQGCRMCVSCA